MQDVFSKHADKWWDADGPFKMLHRMHPHRLECITDSVGSIKGKRVLDYGCGGGLLSESLCQLGADVVGVDQSDEVIKVARHHANKSGLSIDYISGDIDQLDDKYFSNEKFDMVCALECLEHVAHPKRLIACLSSCLKVGGYVAFSTINRNMYGYLLGIIAAEYLLGWVEPGTHEYAYFIRPSECVAMARSANLELQVLNGLSFNMSQQDFYLSSDVSLNYIAIFKKMPDQGQ